MRGIRYNKIPALYLVFAAIIFYAVCSCTREEDSSYGEVTEVTIVLNTRFSATATRTDLAHNESYINTVEVLVFEPDNGQYLYTALGRDITNPLSETALRTFTVTLSKGPCDLVILANSREWIGQSFPSGIPAGTGRTTIFESLIAEHSALWNSIPGSSGFKYMPMWGEKKDLLVADKPLSFELPMIRMMAKVDVTVLEGVEFTLEEAYLYNYNTQGRLIPGTGSWNLATKQVNYPTIPTGATLTKGPLNLNITPGTSTEGEIYIFEALKGTDQLTANTCLVVGGKFRDELSYYRIDFEKITYGQTEYFDIKRNFLYDVQINSVSGPGFPDPDKAFRSQRYGIDATVTDWADGYNGNYGNGNVYRLDITETYIRPGYEGGRFDVTVRTTHPDGWDYTLQYDDVLGGTKNWIDNISLSELPLQNVPVRLSFDVESTSSGDKRKAYLHITSGNLTNTITIEQE